MFSKLSTPLLDQTNFMIAQMKKELETTFSFLIKKPTSEENYEKFKKICLTIKECLKENAYDARGDEDLYACIHKRLVVSTHEDYKLLNQAGSLIQTLKNQYNEPVSSPKKYF